MRSRVAHGIAAVAALGAVAGVAQASTTWDGVTATYTTATNWTNGLPSTGPQDATFSGDQAGEGGGTLVKAITVDGTTARNTIGISFSAATAAGGFTFNTTGNPGFQTRAGSPFNGIVNNDDATQTFNVRVTLFSSTGVAGATAAQTFNAASGNLVFSGNTAGQSGTALTAGTVNNNGGTLTVTGSFNTTIGSAGAAHGELIGAGGLTKTGTGTLTLGGNTANSYSGATLITGGTVALNKPAGTDAIVSASSVTVGDGTGTDVLRLLNSDQIGNTSAMTLSGGTFDINGQDETVGTLALTGAFTSTIDFGAGSGSILNFAASNLTAWNGSAILNIVNWNGVANTGGGTEQLFFGNSVNGLTLGQVGQIRFIDGAAPGGFYPAQILSTGEVVALVPEPSVAGLALLAGAGVAMRRRRHSA